MPETTGGSSGTLTAIEFLKEGFDALGARLDRIDDKLAPLPVLHVRVTVLERIVFGAVALMLVAVLGALIKTVVVP